MATSTNAQNESLRRVAREVLAARPGNSFPVSGIRRRIEQERLIEFRFTDEELLAALRFLQGMNPAQVISTRDSLGNTEYFSATSAGVLAFERGE